MAESGFEPTLPNQKTCALLRFSFGVADQKAGNWAGVLEVALPQPFSYRNSQRKLTWLSVSKEGTKRSKIHTSKGVSPDSEPSARFGVWH